MAFELVSMFAPYIVALLCNRFVDPRGGIPVGTALEDDAGGITSYIGLMYKAAEK